MTIWSIAVNGVMAGCRPEYMPILVALGEAMADPIYGVEHSGNTPGAETLIILNGPIIKDLKFNYEQGAMRDGFMANTSVGRFWRLALRNIAGFLLHKTDKGTFGNTFRVVLAENEDAIAKIGWQPHSVDMGFAAGDNTVTHHALDGRWRTAFRHRQHARSDDALPRRWRSEADRLGNRVHGRRPLHRHVASDPDSSPILARNHRARPVGARTTSSVTSTIMRAWRRGAWRRSWRSGWTSASARCSGKSISAGCRRHSTNPTIRIGRCRSCVEPDDFIVLVSGDPLRTNAYSFTHNGHLGFPVAKKIQLPKNWAERIAEAEEVADPAA